LIKGHPNHPGRPAPEIIYKYSNSDVGFLNHELNAHEVIKHSEAVVVINNTVGFETIYHRKPLLTLGKPPYAETPAVTNVQSLRKLPEALSRAISTTVPEQAIIESVYSLQEATYPGSRANLEPDVVKTHVDSVVSFVDSIST
jgi:capsule polysaccharide modification protein KpsS